jgi:hypothetical protein
MSAQVERGDEPSQRRCPDCGGEMRGIKLLERSHLNQLVQLKYTAEDAEKGWFSDYPVEGLVRGWMCRSCQRIVLYGVPYMRSS